VISQRNFDHSIILFFIRIFLILLKKAILNIFYLTNLSLSDRLIGIIYKKEMFRNCHIFYSKCEEVSLRQNCIKNYIENTNRKNNIRRITYIFFITFFVTILSMRNDLIIYVLMNL